MSRKERKDIKTVGKAFVGYNPVILNFTK